MLAAHQLDQSILPGGRVALEIRQEMNTLEVARLQGGSIRSLALSHDSRMAAMISSSRAVMTSSTKSRMTGQVNSPRLVRRPSATVLGPVCGINAPAALERKASSAPFGSAARTVIPGL